MKYYSLDIKINAFENIMFRLGDGLRLTILAFFKLQEQEVFVDKEHVLEVLTDMSTFTCKKSLKHFSSYVTNALIDDAYVDNEKDKFKFFPFSFYTAPDELFAGETTIPLEMFDYLCFNTWEEIVSQAICNMDEKGDNLSTEYIHIPFSVYSSFYEAKIKAYNINSKDDICAKFLSDLHDFFIYNHILNISDFGLNEATYELMIPIKFDFSKIL